MNPPLLVDIVLAWRVFNVKAGPVAQLRPAPQQAPGKGGPSRFASQLRLAGVGTRRAVRGPLAFASRIAEFHHASPLKSPESTTTWAPTATATDSQQRITLTTHSQQSRRRDFFRRRRVVVPQKHTPTSRCSASGSTPFQFLVKQGANRPLATPRSPRHLAYPHLFPLYPPNPYYKGTLGTSSRDEARLVDVGLGIEEKNVFQRRPFAERPSTVNEAALGKLSDKEPRAPRGLPNQGLFPLSGTFSSTGFA